MVVRFGISFINAVLNIAGAVFLFAGSKTILNFLFYVFLSVVLLVLNILISAYNWIIKYRSFYSL